MVQVIRRRGSVLIVALGVMTVLVVLAVVFANLTSVERKISGNYVNLVKAKMLAQSGVEYAFTEIGNIFYWGNDGIDNDGDGSTDEADEQRPSIAEDANNPLLYGRRTPLPVLYDPTIPLERAYYVSLARMSGPTTPLLVQIDMGMNSLIPGATPGGVDSSTQNFGLSGEVQATYLGGRDYYALKIVDCQGKIYINGPDVNDTNPDVGVASGVAALTSNTISLLNNLGNILSTPITNLGNRISTYRQSIGANITTKQSLMSGLVPALTQQQYDALAPHVTAVAWVDYTTLHPDSLQTQYQLNGTRPDDPTPLYNSIPISCADPMDGMEYVDGERSALKEGLAKIFRVGDDCKYSCGSERLVSHGPGYYAAHYTTYTNTSEQNTNSSAANGPCIQPRAPVNINTASDLVLRTLLTGLRGRYQVFNASTTEPNVHMGPGHTSTYETTIDAAVAQNVATAMVTARNTLVANRGFSFATWYDFEQFVDSLTDVQVGSSGDIARARRDIIKANFNPNSKINKFNPDRVLGTRFAQTDKADLLYWTTEFCFNTAGYFEIESMGRILGPPNPAGAAPIMAEKKVLTTIRVYDMIKQSTQAQFYVNAVNSTPTQVAFFPESMTDNNSTSQAAAYSWYTGNNPNPNSIPNYTMAAQYDGRFAAQTMDCNGANGGNCFQAHYTTDFDFYQNGTSDQNDAAGPAEEGVSLINTATGGGGVGGQSELFPDGLFVHETRRYPTYTNTQWRYGASQLNCLDDYVRNQPASGKISMQAGTVDMWVKPTWSAREFPCASSSDAHEPNPHALGSRTLFSFGYGSNSWPYQYLNGGTYTKDIPYCDNRIVIAARTRGGNNQNNTYMFGWAGSRLASAPYFSNGGGLTISEGAQPMTDFYSFWCKTAANWFFLTQNVIESQYTVAHAWNPRNWTYPGVWHHVRLVWENGRTGRMFLDGQADGSGAITSGRTVTVFPGNSFGNSSTQDATDRQVDNPSQWSIFPGTSRFQRRTTNGYICTGDVTIDDLKIYTSALVGTGTASFTPPHKYAASTVYESRIGPAAGDNPLNPAQTAMPLIGSLSSGKVAMIAWTIMYPKYTNCSSNVTMSVSSTSPFSQDIANLAELASRCPHASHAHPALPGASAFKLPCAMHGLAQELQGRGVAVTNVNFQPAGPVGAELRYRASFDLNAGPPGTPAVVWRSATPHVDDVTIILLPGSPTMLYYALE